MTGLRAPTSAENKDYLEQSAELATKMAAVIGDFVEHGAPKERFEELAHRQGVSER